MKPLDPKLLRYARAARGYLALTVTTGLATAGLVVAQAVILGRTLGGAVHDGLDLSGAATAITWLVVVVAARFGLTVVQERYAHRAATAAVNELREQVVAHGAALGPRWLATGQGPTLVTLSTRGLDALEPYFVNYLPQLVLAATLTPATLIVVLSFDWLSALIIALTIPLVPFFMILVGRLTQGRSEKGLAAMERLGSQVLDLISGLPTLRALGRQGGPVRRVQELGDAHRRATMGTLRIAFLSGMVLELLTTISVALVAVTIGFRLVYGDTDLVTALTVLVLAPEVFNPLRAVGTQYHASTDGVAAAEAAFTVLETPVTPAGDQPCPDLRTSCVRLTGVGVRSSGGWTPHELSLELTSGRVTALVGRSGIGKSTAVEVLLGLLTPDAGHVEVVSSTGATTDLRAIEPRSYWDQIAWLPQRPFLEPGTLGQLVGDVPADVRDRAAALTGLDRVVAGLPAGWDTDLATGGTGLSVGQRQRVALTRALVRPAPLVVLDEPTAHLDSAGEQVVLDTVDALRRAGSAVLLVAHRASLVATADVVVEVSHLAENEPDPSAAGPTAPGPSTPGVLLDEPGVSA